MKHSFDEVDTSIETITNTLLSDMLNSKDPKEWLRAIMVKALNGALSDNINEINSRNIESHTYLMILTEVFVATMTSSVVSFYQNKDIQKEAIAKINDYTSSYFNAYINRMDE
ncbi:MAG: hypothetical protein WC284_08785 [Candidimonas sp.]